MINSSAKKSEIIQLRNWLGKHAQFHICRNDSAHTKHETKAKTLSKYQAIELWCNISLDDNSVLSVQLSEHYARDSYTYLYHRFDCFLHFNERNEHSP